MLYILIGFLFSLGVVIWLGFRGVLRKEDIGPIILIGALWVPCSFMAARVIIGVTVYDDGIYKESRLVKEERLEFFQIQGSKVNYSDGSKIKTANNLKEVYVGKENKIFFYKEKIDKKMKYWLFLPEKEYQKIEIKP